MTGFLGADTLAARHQQQDQAISYSMGSWHCVKLRYLKAERCPISDRYFVALYNKLKHISIFNSNRETIDPDVTNLWLTGNSGKMFAVLFQNLSECMEDFKNDLVPEPEEGPPVLSTGRGSGKNGPPNLTEDLC